MAAPRAAIRRTAGAIAYAPAIFSSLRALFPRVFIQTATKTAALNTMLWRDSKGAQPLWSDPGQSPTAYAKSQIIYEVVCYGDENWGSGSPFFQKTSVISTRLTYKKVKSMVGSKGLEPLGVVWGTVYAKLQKTYEGARCGDEKWGSGSPFFQKTIVISTRLTNKNVKSIVGSKGLEPLGVVWGGAPKELFVLRGFQGA